MHIYWGKIEPRAAEQQYVCKTENHQIIIALRAAEALVMQTVLVADKNRHDRVNRAARYPTHYLHHK